MKAKSVTIDRLINTGNISHVKIGVTLELERGETAQQALDKATVFIDRNDPNLRTLKEQKMRAAMAIAADADNQPPRLVRAAKAEMGALTNEKDIPF